MSKGKAFPPEFRAEAVRLYRMSGRSQKAVAREIGVATNTLGRWVRQADIDDDGSVTSGLTSDEKEELAHHRGLPTCPRRWCDGRRLLRLEEAARLCQGALG